MLVIDPSGRFRGMAKGAVAPSFLLSLEIRMGVAPPRPPASEVQRYNPEISPFPQKILDLPLDTCCSTIYSYVWFILGFTALVA